MNPVIMIFVDGLGIGDRDAVDNPVVAAGVSCLAPEPHRVSPIAGGGWQAPTDARLGVPGLPQSATGQTTLLSGVNAALEIGRHRVGFPNLELRRILYRRNLLRSVVARGGRAGFVNCYPTNAAYLNGRIAVDANGDLLAASDVPAPVLRRLSVTTIAALSIGQRFRDLDDLRRGASLYHDFTNRSLIAEGHDLAPLSPAAAGRILHECAAELDFVLYEHFLTDRLGHARDFSASIDHLRQLDDFLHGILDAVGTTTTTVILASDHGNIEDATTGQHTTNPVPTVFWGPRARELAARVKSLTDVHDCALAAMTDD
jgi:hypothetical protein